MRHSPLPSVHLLRFAFGLSIILLLLGVFAEASDGDAAVQGGATDSVTAMAALSDSDGQIDTSTGSTDCDGVDPQLLASIIALVGQAAAQHECPAAQEGLVAGGADDLPSLTFPGDHLVGDANCDSAIQTEDVLSVLLVSAGLAVQDNCASAGDVNCNGKLDSADALGILVTISAASWSEPGCPAIGSGSLVVLTLDKFGGGSVSGAIACDSDCSRYQALFPAGAEVTLTAVPDSGWELYPWSGCTSASADSVYCNVTLTEDTTVFATFGSTAPVGLKPGTRLLDSATMQKFLGQEGDPAGELTLIFGASAGSVATLQPGEVIASSDHDHPFIRRVIAVTKEASEIHVLSEPAGLADAFGSGTLIIQDALAGPSGAGSREQGIQSDATPTPTATPPTPPCLLNPTVIHPFEPGASAKMCIDPKFELSISFAPFELRAVLTMRLEGTLTITNVTKNFGGRIFSCSSGCLPTFNFQAGPVPIIIQPEINVDFGATLSAELNTSVTVGGTLTLGIAHTQENGWQGIANAVPKFVVKPPQTPKLVAEISLSPSAAVKLYEVIGPTFGVTGYVRIEHELLLAQSFWYVSAGLKLESGIELGWSIFSIGWKFPIKEWKWPLFILPEGAAGSVRLERTQGGKISQPLSTLSFGALDNCGAWEPCERQYSYPINTGMTLTPGELEPGWVFGSWQGCDAVVGDACSVTITGIKNLKATFHTGAPNLNVVSAHGDVILNGKDNCPSPGCQLPGYSMTLKAYASEGYRFAGWSGCDSELSNGICSMTLGNADETVTALYVKSTKLTLQLSAGGAVTRAPGGEHVCLSGCSLTFIHDEGASLTLTAEPKAGFKFVHWEPGLGCASIGGVTGEICTVTMDMDKAVEAVFTPGQTLQVNVLPDPLSGGEGYVNSSPAGIVCGAGYSGGPCAWGFDMNQVVTLTAHPSDPLTKVTWGAVCTPVSGNPYACKVKMSQATNVTATFQAHVLLTVGAQQGGKILGDRIACGNGATDCTEIYPRNSTTTLTLVPDEEYFAGGCGGQVISTTCKVGLSPVSACCPIVPVNHMEVTGLFGLIPNLLTINVNGEGRVTSSPAGIDCLNNEGGDCQQRYPTGAYVSLTAVPAPGWKLDKATGVEGWDGCNFVTAAYVCLLPGIAGYQYAGATFVPVVGKTLTVTLSGATNAGSKVTSNDERIYCPGDCFEDYEQTSPLVTLTATPYGGDNFVGWSQSCQSIGYLQCQVSLAQSQSVTAYFVGTSPAPTQIAFSSNRDGISEIYVMNPDGTNRIRLTNNSASDGGPSWSPDGTRIAFVSNRDGNSEIYVMNADGSGQTRLTNNAAQDYSQDYSPSWSPDGTKIAFYTLPGIGSSQIYVMNADGSGQVNVSNNSWDDARPSWSPDGTKIAFDSFRDGRSQIYVMNADGSVPTNLSASDEDDFLASWSPDGTRIAFASLQSGLAVMNADGSDRTSLCECGWTSSWSPDSSRLALDTSFYLSTKGDILVMNADGSGLTNISNNTKGFFDVGPSWGIAADLEAATLGTTLPAGSGVAAPGASTGGVPVDLGAGQAGPASAASCISPFGTLGLYGANDRGVRRPAVFERVRRRCLTNTTQRLMATSTQMARNRLGSSGRAI